jgi:hypothetical protein
MIQQGVSVGGSASPDGMNIGRVMDWIEARLEAVKSREEEEEEDEEREKGADHAGAKQDAGTVKASRMPTPLSRHKENVSHSRCYKLHPIETGAQASHIPLTPQPVNVAPNNANASTQVPSSQPSTQSTPPSHHVPLRPIHALPHPPFRLSKSRPNGSKAHSFPATPSETPHSLPSPPVVFASSEGHPPITELAAGAKRRHAVMMMLDSASASSPSLQGSAATATSQPGSSAAIPNSGTGHSRRRTRSSRSGQNYNQGDAMEVEEEGGRERKRVARR